MVSQVLSDSAVCYLACAVLLCSICCRSPDPGAVDWLYELGQKSAPQQEPTPRDVSTAPKHCPAAININININSAWQHG